MPVPILLVTKISGLEEMLRAANLAGIDIIRTKSDDATAAAIASAEVIFGDPSIVAPHIGRANSLKWMQSTMAGVEALTQADPRKTDYILTRLKGVLGLQMAEYVMGQILQRERRMFARMADQTAKVWGEQHQRRLRGLTLGILGAGDLGQAVAAAARQFGMTVWGLRQHPEPTGAIDKLFTPERLDDLLAGVDYIVNVLPSTAQTINLLSGGRLKKARSSAIFINIGRGDIINEASIVEAVTHGWIAGATLDVFAAEPLPEASPLWDLPGVIITPHVASLSYPQDCVELFAANLDRYLSGKQVQHRVDWELGY